MHSVWNLPKMSHFDLTKNFKIRAKKYENCIFTYKMRLLIDFQTL